MNNHMTYFEKLKDPRWQKLRLEVMERDEFTCARCRAKEKTLTVHHIVYRNGHEPWDVPLDDLKTLCEDCHRLADDKDLNWVFRYLLATSPLPKGVLMDIARMLVLCLPDEENGRNASDLLLEAAGVAKWREGRYQGREDVAELMEETRSVAEGTETDKPIA